MPVKQNRIIPSVEVPKSTICYNNQESNWYLNDQLFSGYMLSYHSNGVLSEKAQVLNGRLENELEKWYPNGQLQLLETYRKGRLHGAKKMWIVDCSHTLVASLNYYDGRPHGIQMQWYPTGELYKVLSLNMGKEEGMQKAYRKNGELYANYEAKNGRTFGLKKATLCYGLNEEKVQYEK